MGTFQKGACTPVHTHVYFPWSRGGTGRAVSWHGEGPKPPLTRQNRVLYTRSSSSGEYPLTCDDDAQNHVYTLVYTFVVYCSCMASTKRYTAKDGTETWRVRYRLLGRSCSQTFKTEAAAKWFAEMVDLAGPEHALEFIKKSTEPQRKAYGQTVAECVERFISTRPNPSTQRVYRRYLAIHIEPTLGDIRINQLTKDHVRNWVNAQDKLARNSIARNHALLHSALEEAVEREEITSNPAKKVSVPRRSTALSRKRAALMPPLTQDEYTLIRKATPSYAQLLVEFLAETGCRFGEAAALTPADVNLDTNTVHIHQSFSYHQGDGYSIGRTKTIESDRIIPVKRSLLERLDLTGEYVFLNTMAQPWKNNSFRTGPWRLAKKNSGLPPHRWPHPHDLRHAHVCWLLDAGIPLPAIQKRVGHADVRTTLGMYSHAMANSDERILSALDSLD